LGLKSLFERLINEKENHLKMRIFVRIQFLKDEKKAE
jgi:hypothetical protein